MSSLISSFINILKRMIDLSILTICQNNVDIVEEIAMLKVKTSMMTTGHQGSRVLSMVNGEPVNRSGGDGLVIPVGPTLEGYTKAIAWAKKKIQFTMIE